MNFFKSIYNLIIQFRKDIANDTLKREKGGKLKYSPTLMTMAMASFTVFASYWLDFLQNGYRSESFILMVTMAGVIRLPDAFSKRINPYTTTEKHETDK